MPERKEIGAALLWATLTVLALLLAFALGRFSVNTERVRLDAFNALEAAIAECSLAEARAGRCFIPCASDSDCLEKNGRTEY